MDGKTPRPHGLRSNTISVEVAIADSEHTSYRWRNQYRGMADAYLPPGGAAVQDASKRQAWAADKGTD